MRLPKYLVVILDRDIITDLDASLQLCQIQIILMELVHWLVRQINMVIHCKRVDLLEVKPDAGWGCHTKIIFIRMIRRPGNGNALSSLIYPKCNDCLNDAVAKIKFPIKPDPPQI